jgi:hypothetical protein
MNPGRLEEPFYNPHRPLSRLPQYSQMMADPAIAAVRISSPCRTAKFSLNRFRTFATSQAASRYSPQSGAPRLSQAAWPPIAGRVPPQNRRRRAPGRFGRGRKSTRIVPRRTRAAKSGVASSYSARGHLPAIKGKTPSFYGMDSL